jgi:hypothetical protein
MITPSERFRFDQETDVLGQQKRKRHLRRRNYCWRKRRRSIKLPLAGRMSGFAPAKQFSLQQVGRKQSSGLEQ